MDFVNKSYDDPELAKRDFETTLKFIKSCTLTGDEFIIALNLVSQQELTDIDNKPIKYFRDINIANFNLYSSAYIQFKNQFKPYIQGKEEIRKFLIPPPPEKTEEEKKKERLKFYETEYIRLTQGKELLGSNIFYELVKKDGVSKINLKFLENVLSKFQPETTENALSVSKGDISNMLPRKIKHDVQVYFANELVKSYIDINKLSSLSLNQWCEHWEKIHNK